MTYSTETIVHTQKNPTNFSKTSSATNAHFQPAEPTTHTSCFALFCIWPLVMPRLFLYKGISFYLPWAQFTVFTEAETWGAKHRYNMLNKIHWARAQVCQFSLSSYKYLYPLLNEEKKTKDMERKCKLEVVQSLKVPGRAHLWLCGESPCRRVFANGWWPEESTMVIADILIWA